MISRISRQSVVAAAALLVTAGAQALTFNYTFTPTSTQADKDAFMAAGAIWSSLFTDDITINLSVGTDTLAAPVASRVASGGVPCSAGGPGEAVNSAMVRAVNPAPGGVPGTTSPASP